MWRMSIKIFEKQKGFSCRAPIASRSTTSTGGGGGGVDGASSATAAATGGNRNPNRPPIPNDANRNQNQNNMMTADRMEKEQEKLTVVCAAHKQGHWLYFFIADV